MSHELLLLLQDIRLSSDILTAVMNVISSPLFHIAVPVAIAAYILWCVDWRKGEWMLMNIVTGMFFAHLLKDIIKNPRPWETDSRIEPAEKAPDYSTPSGHTVDSITGYGSLMIMMKKRWSTILLSIMIAAIAFSRLFLGVHTVLDILAGAVVAVILMITNGILLNVAYEKGRYNTVSVLYALVLITGLLIWYLVAGPNGQIMIYGGLMAGALIGRQLNHDILRYEVEDVASSSKIIRFLIGGIVTALLFLIPYLLLHNETGAMIGCFACMIGLFCISPALVEKMR